jgi:hypothetical protein
MRVSLIILEVHACVRLTNDIESDHRRCDANAPRRLDGVESHHTARWALIDVVELFRKLDSFISLASLSICWLIEQNM